MQVSIKKLPKSKIELTCEISSADFAQYLDKAVENLAKELEIKGFRKGFVPREIAKNHLSQKEILEEAVNLAVNDTFPKAIKENKLEVIDLPKVEVLKIAPQNPLVYKVLVSVLPEIELPDYKEISTEINNRNKEALERKLKVEEKEINDAILRLQKSRAKYITVSREVRAGNCIKIKLKIKNLPRTVPEALARGQISKISEGQLFRDREKVDLFNQGAEVGGIEEHEGILGSGYFLPDFEKELLGMRAGEQKSFLQEIPINHINKELAGKTLDFEVKMNLVQEVELPEINDEFAKNLGDFESIQNLRQNIAEGIRTEKEEKEKQKNRQELIQKIARESRLEIPDILVEKKTEQEIFNLKQNIEASGLNFQQYLEELKKTEDEFKKDLHFGAENQVKIALVLHRLAEVERIEVSEEEIKEKVAQYLKRSSDDSKYQNIKMSRIDPERLKLYYEDAIKNEKTFKLLENY